MHAIIRSSASLLLAAVLCLSACQTLPPPSKPPTPPLVDCEQGKTDDVAPWPTLAAGAPITDAWVKAATSWANGTLGILTGERQLRYEEHTCLHRLAKESSIRLPEPPPVKPPERPPSQ